MNEMQSKLTEMMKFFHSFCTENGLRYYALGGTALGAVRHKGFIPWDDDIDVGMPRADYERLKTLVDIINQNGRYVIEFPLQNVDYYYPICKLYDVNTTLVENTRAKTKRGIFIDIFPLDGIGNTIEDSIKNFNKVDFWRNLFNVKNCAVRENRNFFKNCAVVIGNLVPECILNRKRLISKIHNMGMQRAWDDYNYVVNLFGAWHEKEITKKSCFGDPKLAEFEDMYIYIPFDVHGYLTALYGNYMELPPIEKRVTHHDFVLCDLNKSYKE